MNTKEIKSSLLTLAHENPQDFFKLLEEVLEETVQNQAQRSRLDKLKKLIQADFDQYDEVFRRLA